jgi:hypothetical protein
MCGIAGWVSYDANLKTHRDVISTMTKTMARRGPDAGGVWIDGHVGLGHRRLAVIDFAGGVQPMQAERSGTLDDQLAPFETFTLSRPRRDYAASKRISCAPCQSVRSPRGRSCSRPSVTVRKWFPASGPALLANATAP